MPHNNYGVSPLPSAYMSFTIMKAMMEVIVIRISQITIARQQVNYLRCALWSAVPS